MFQGHVRFDTAPALVHLRALAEGAAGRRPSVVGARRRGQGRGLARQSCRQLTEDGRHRLVRQGHLPVREIMTCIGTVAVRCPRVRDRVGEGSERIRFSSAILPPSKT